MVRVGTWADANRIDLIEPFVLGDPLGEIRIRVVESKYRVTKSREIKIRIESELFNYQVMVEFYLGTKNRNQILSEQMKEIQNGTYVVMRKGKGEGSFNSLPRGCQDIRRDVQIGFVSIVTALLPQILRDPRVISAHNEFLLQQVPVMIEATDGLIRMLKGLLIHAGGDPG